MAASKIRWNGELKHTVQYSRPVRPAQARAAGASATTEVEYFNCSGFINTNTLTAYNPSTSFYMVNAEFNVPTVSQAVNSCDGGWDWEVSWNGIDGDLDPNALLQGGTASGAGILQWFDQAVELLRLGRVVPPTTCCRSSR
ncbi:MAG TPA: G1 family glutamic endopeptidase [Terriglobales bacterium]|nr:G1 family glutamic endopeptidase [Terriglobales bacterium]